MARPKAKIDWQYVDECLEAQCTGTEIAASIGVHPETLYNACERDHKMGFSAYSQIKRESGLAILRLKQFRLAKNEDKAMLIWLGKQHLGQSEKQDSNINADIKLPQIKWADDEDSTED